MTRAVSVLLFLKVFMAVSVIGIFTEQKQFLHHCMKVENASALKFNPFRHKVLPTKEARYANSIDYLTYMHPKFKLDTKDLPARKKYFQGRSLGSVLITESMDENNPWYDFGLRPGDVITKVTTTHYNKEIENISDFFNGRTVFKLPTDEPFDNLYFTWEKEYIKDKDMTALTDKS